MGICRKEVRNGRLIIWTNEKGWELGAGIVEHNTVPAYTKQLPKAEFKFIQFIRNLEREKYGKFSNASREMGD